MKVQEIAVDKIKVIENCRTGIGDHEIIHLMRSIKQHGLEQPIGVCKNGVSGYHLIYGHRRLEAFRKLGYKTIPAVINESKNTVDSMILNLIENLQRVDITPQELGRVCKELIKLGLNKNEIATRLDVAVGRVENSLGMIGVISDKYLKKVRFINKGSKNNGSIPAEVANEVVNIRRNCGLSKPQVDKLMEAIQENSFSTQEMCIVGHFIKEGYSIKDAVKNTTQYMVVRLDFTMKRDDMEKLKEKYQSTLTPIIRKIVYGELPPIKKPEFEN